MKNFVNTKIIIAISLVLIVSGCAGFQPLSNYARPGDTVALAISATDEGNAQVPVLKKDNVTVTVTDSLNNTYPVKLRYLFRTYADYTSEYSYNRIKGLNEDFIEYSSLMQGQWMGIIDLVDPDTGNDIPLEPGMATIKVTSSDLVDFVSSSPNYFTWNNGNLQEISIEILPGTGSSNMLNYLSPISYDPMLKLEPLQQIEISPVVGVSGPFTGLIGGAEFIFTINNADFGSGVKAVPAIHDPGIQLGFNQVDNGDGTSQLKVVVMNPAGIKPDNSRDLVDSFEKTLKKGGSIFRSLGFNLVWDKGTVDNSNWANSIQINSYKYIDINGNDIPASYINYSMNKVN